MNPNFNINDSRLCVGLDPSGSLLQKWGLTDDLAGLQEFSRIAESALAHEISTVKVQVAFFERFSWRGLEVMDTLIHDMRAIGCTVIADAKRGDIGTTADAYADAWFAGNDSADALTVTPWFGFDSLEPFFERADKHGRLVFVVCRASNPESSDIQRARQEERNLAEILCDSIAVRNSHAERPVAGAVIGATQGEEFASLAARLDGAPILAPGIGAQGATLKSLKKSAGRYYAQVIPSASRSLLEHGPDPENLANEIRRARAQARDLRCVTQPGQVRKQKSYEATHAAQAQAQDLHGATQVARA